MHLLYLLGFSDDFRVEEVVWPHFVDGGEYYPSTVWAVKYGYGKGVDVLALVHVLASPNSCFVEGLVGFGGVENLEEGDRLLQVVVVEYGEDVVTREHALFVPGDELLNAGRGLLQKIRSYGTSLRVIRIMLGSYLEFSNMGFQLEGVDDVLVVLGWRHLIYMP